MKVAYFSVYRPNKGLSTKIVGCFYTQEEAIHDLIVVLVKEEIFPYQMYVDQYDPELDCEESKYRPLYKKLLDEGEYMQCLSGILKDVQDLYTYFEEMVGKPENGFELEIGFTEPYL